MSVNVQLTVHTAHGRGDVVANALRSKAGKHLRGDPKMTADPCRGDRIELLTDDVCFVARVARKAEASARVIGTPKCA